MAESLNNTSQFAGSLPGASRRRDKPQLSCNLCRRRKLRCDRGQPCGPCARRSLSLSCTYASSGTSEQAGRPYDRSTVTPRFPDYTVQIGRLDTSPMGIANSARPTGQMSPVTRSWSQTEELSVSMHEPPTPRLHDSLQPTHPFGRISIGSTETIFVESSHWTAILDGISELKEPFDDHSRNEGQELLVTASDSDEPDILFGNYRRINKQEILAAIPPRPTVDRLVAEYSNHRAITPVIIHSSTFLQEYERFWEQPLEAPITWVGLLFAVMCLAATYQQKSNPQLLDLKRDIQTYREKTIQCLVLSKYTNCAPYTIEILLLYLHVEYLRSEDIRMETWILLGVIVRLALRMGYHRDASHFPQISSFHGEMRRRAWALIIQFDALTSAQLGLPRMIRESHFDTAEPLNLLDEDFHEDINALPLPRPDTIETPIQYIVAKNQIVTVYGMISDLTTSITPPPYTEVMRLDKILYNTYELIPQMLHMRPMVKSLMDTPDTIVRRLHVDLIFQKAKCVLHRRYLLPARTDDRYAYSRSSCTEAALQILEHHWMLNQETQVGGRIYQDRWKISPFVKSSFFLAATLLCLELDYDITAELSSDPQTDADMRSRVIQVLHNSYTIWTQSSGSSQEARKAAEALSVVLSKSQNMNMSKSADLGITVGNMPALGGDSFSPSTDHSFGMEGPPRPQYPNSRVSPDERGHPISIHYLMGRNADAHIDYSGITTEPLDLVGFQTQSFGQALEASSNFPRRSTYPADEGQNTMVNSRWRT